MERPEAVPSQLRGASELGARVGATLLRRAHDGGGLVSFSIPRPGCLGGALRLPGAETGSL